MPFCHALWMYANTLRENGLLERAPEVHNSKMYAMWKLKQTGQSFSETEKKKLFNLVIQITGLINGDELSRRLKTLCRSVESTLILYSVYKTFDWTCSELHGKAAAHGSHGVISLHTFLFMFITYIENILKYF